MPPTDVEALCAVRHSPNFHPALYLQLSVAGATAKVIRCYTPHGRSPDRDHDLILVDVFNLRWRLIS
jgi:hypothetical protein